MRLLNDISTAARERKIDIDLGEDLEKLYATINFWPFCLAHGLNLTFGDAAVDPTHRILGLVDMRATSPIEKASVTIPCDAPPGALKLVLLSLRESLMGIPLGERNDITNPQTDTRACWDEETSDRLFREAQFGRFSALMARYQN